MESFQKKPFFLHLVGPVVALFGLFIFLNSLKFYTHLQNPGLPPDTTQTLKAAIAGSILMGLVYLVIGLGFVARKFWPRKALLVAYPAGWMLNLILPRLTSTSVEGKELHTRIALLQLPIILFLTALVYWYFFTKKHVTEYYRGLSERSGKKGPP